MTDNEIHEAITRLIESGKLEIQIDDSDLRKTIGDVAMNAKRQLDSAAGSLEKSLRADINNRVTADRVAETLGTLNRGIMDDVDKRIADAVSKVRPSVTFDEAKLRSISDEVCQSLLGAKTAKALASGEVAPLPKLLKVDPFFVETSQTARIEWFLKTRRHAMVSGPSGSGKTYPVEMVLRKHGRRYLKVSVADGLTLSDFVARPNVRATDKGTETYYTYGFLVFAMLNGLVLILDEIDQCQPEIVSILNAALEARSLYLPQTGETITAKPEWQVFMTCNTLRDTTGNYAGFRLNAALLNRVRFVKADYLAAKEECAIIQRVGLTERDASVIVSIMQGLRNAYIAGKLTQAPSTRIAVDIARCVLGQDAEGNKATKPMKLTEAFEVCLLDGLPDTELAEALAVLKSGI